MQSVHSRAVLRIEQDRSSNVRTWLSTGAVCFVIGGFLLFWRGPMPFQRLIRVFAGMDKWHDGLSLASNPETLRRYYSWSVATPFLLTALLAFGKTAWTQLDEATRRAIYRLTITLAISCTLMVYLFRMEFAGPWVPISTVMKNPSMLPIYGHRLLFVWVAKVFEKFVPHMTDMRSFYLSQAVAILLTVYALGKWSALHVGEVFSWLGQITGAVLISTCFSYYDFYDIGTVFFTTCALMAIYTKRYWWLVLVVTIGTLNYEGLLLLIPLAAFMAYDKDPPQKWVAPVVASLFAYCAIRFALQFAIPFSHQFDWRIWSNMTKPFLLHTEMALCILGLGGWYAVGLMSLQYCDPQLKRLILLFPLVFAVTFLFGQLHEARQFDAFIPVLVAIIISACKRNERLIVASYETAWKDAREHG